jgi:hypothetical protein
MWPDRRHERIDWALRLFEEQMTRSSWLDDDSIPYLSMTTGTEIFAEALGCGVYRPKDNMPFAIPHIHDADEASHLVIPHVQDTSLMNLIAMASELRECSGSEAPLKLPDLQSPMDILAQVWDKSDLFMAFVDDPERVLDLSSRISGFLTEFLDLWFKEFGNQYIAHHPDYYMEGGLTLSVDEIGNVSPTLFEHFFLNELNQLSRHFGGIGIHCCANSEHQWEGLSRVEGLRLVNLARPMDVFMRAFHHFPEQAHYPWLLIDGVSQQMPDLFPWDYPKGARVVITQHATRKEEAIRKADRLRIACC